MRFSKGEVRLKIDSISFTSKQKEKHFLVKQKEPCDLTKSFDMEI